VPMAKFFIVERAKRFKHFKLGKANFSNRRNFGRPSSRPDGQPDDAAIIAKAVFAIDPGESFRNRKSITRLAIYQLLDLLIEKHTPSLQKHIGTDDFIVERAKCFKSLKVGEAN
jgi:hypothetical protein